MALNFDCVIDTTEMAKEVSSVKKHVDGTTTAVVGMQTAVIKAQNDGADRVCKKVNQGFYSLIHSQISQKMATLQSKVDAQLMRLNQQQKQLVSIRSRMERDYQMLCARYSKLFTGINRNLRQRITELDQPVISFANKEAEQISNRGNQLIATVPVGQDESVRTAQNVAASNLKYRASGAIEAINRFIADSSRVQRLIDSILLRRPMEIISEENSVPVGIMESNYDSSRSVQTSIYVSQMPLSESSRRDIENRMSELQREDGLKWKSESAINPEVVNRFRQLVSASKLDSRRKDVMLKMFESQPFETLE